MLSTTNAEASRIPARNVCGILMSRGTGCQSLDPTSLNCGAGPVCASALPGLPGSRVCLDVPQNANTDVGGDEVPYRSRRQIFGMKRGPVGALLFSQLAGLG